MGDFKRLNAVIIANSANLGDLVAFCVKHGHSFDNVNLITSVHRTHFSFIHFVRRQVFCFGVGQGLTGTMGFAGV